MYIEWATSEETVVDKPIDELACDLPTLLRVNNSDRQISTWISRKVKTASKRRHRKRRTRSRDYCISRSSKQIQAIALGNKARGRKEPARGGLSDYPGLSYQRFPYPSSSQLTNTVARYVQSNPYPALETHHSEGIISLRKLSGFVYTPSSSGVSRRSASPR